MLRSFLSSVWFFSDISCGSADSAESASSIPSAPHAKTSAHHPHNYPKRISIPAMVASANRLVPAPLHSALFQHRDLTAPNLSPWSPSSDRLATADDYTNGISSSTPRRWPTRGPTLTGTCPPSVSDGGLSDRCRPSPPPSPPRVRGASSHAIEAGMPSTPTPPVSPRPARAHATMMESFIGGPFATLPDFRGRHFGPRQPILSLVHPGAAMDTSVDEQDVRSLAIALDIIQPIQPSSLPCRTRPSWAVPFDPAAAGQMLTMLPIWRDDRDPISQQHRAARSQPVAALPRKGMSSKGSRTKSKRSISALRMPRIFSSSTMPTRAARASTRR